MEPTAGTCGWCGRPLDGRVDKQYCGGSCRRSARRKRKKDRERSNSLSQSAQSSEPQGASSEADARFRAMLAADKASRTPSEQEGQWARHARRHGTIHPDEQADRIARGRRASADDWQQGTQPFARQPMTVAELGRAQRQRQLRPLSSYGSDPGCAGPPAWDDDDPEQPGEMIDLGDWRRGRKW